MFESHESKIPFSGWIPRGIHHEDPFPFVLYPSVFATAQAHELRKSFEAIKAAGCSESRRSIGFHRMFSHYDAYAAELPNEMDNALRVFANWTWHSFLAGHSSRTATGDMKVELHHHPIGSPTGKVHTDLSFGHFTDVSKESPVNLHNSSLCSYRSGTIRGERVAVRRVQRTVAAIYYLANGRWHDGDGGETALYSRDDAQRGSPTRLIPPLNNSMLVFECSSRSWHNFICNKAQERNAVVMWTHSVPSEEMF